MNKPESLILNDAERDDFLAKLENPPAPNEYLKQAHKKYESAKADGTIKSSADRETWESL